MAHLNVFYVIPLLKPWNTCSTHVMLWTVCGLMFINCFRKLTERLPASSRPFLHGERGIIKALLLIEHGFWLLVLSSGSNGKSGIVGFFKIVNFLLRKYGPLLSKESVRPFWLKNGIMTMGGFCSEAANPSTAKCSRRNGSTLLLETGVVTLSG